MGQALERSAECQAGRREPRSAAAAPDPMAGGMSSFREGAWTQPCPQGRARSDTRFAPALRLSGVQAAHQRVHCPLNTGPDPPLLDSSLRLENQAAGLPAGASPNATQPGRGPGTWAADHLHSRGRLQAGFRACGWGHKGPRDPGQKWLWAAWVRAPDGLASGPGTSGSTAQSRESHHRLRDVCGCPRRVWNLGRHTKPDLREGPRGPGAQGSTRAAPPGTLGAAQAGAARTGAGRPEEAGGSWPCSGLRPPGPVPLVQLQPGGGKAEGIPETGMGFAWAPAGHTATPCAEAVGPQSVAGTTPESPGGAEWSRFPGTPGR